MLTWIFLQLVNSLYIKDPMLEWGVGFICHFSTLIKGPVSFIFACMLGENFKEVIPIYQICIMSSIIILPPCHYLLSKALMPDDFISTTVRDKLKLRSAARKNLKIDPDNPQPWYLMEEYWLKPLLIRDYTSRYKELKKIHRVFSKVNDALEHGEDVHGHGHGGGEEHGHKKPKLYNAAHELEKKKLAKIETLKDMDISSSEETPVDRTMNKGGMVALTSAFGADANTGGKKGLLFGMKTNTDSDKKEKNPLDGIKVESAPMMELFATKKNDIKAPLLDNVDVTGGKADNMASPIKSPNKPYMDSKLFPVKED